MTTTAGDGQQLQRVADYLRQVPAWFLATSVDNRPHVRPFSFVEVEPTTDSHARLWFCTARGKDVYDELMANPYFELSAWHPGHPWLVAWGKAVFAEPSAGLRQRGFEHMVGLGEAHENANDGLLVFFYLEQGQAKICDITGEEQIFAL